MGLYKAKIKSDGIIEKLELRIVVRGGLKNKEIIGDTRSPTASMRTPKYILSDASKKKSRVHQLDFIVVFLYSNAKYMFFVKLDRIYGDYFP